MADPLMVTVAAAAVAVALAITLAGRRHAYPPGSRKESGWSEPEVKEPVLQH